MSLVAAGCAVAVGACGSSSQPKPGSEGVSARLVRYSACIRAHGVPGFPDPSTTQGPNAMGIDGYNFNLPASLDLQSPAYQSATEACGRLLGSGSGARPELSAKARQAALAHAECMRQHGVPDFPDPIVTSSGQGITVRSGAPGLNPRSPAFQRAEKDCQRPG